MQASGRSATRAERLLTHISQAAHCASSPSLSLEPGQHFLQFLLVHAALGRNEKLRVHAVPFTWRGKVNRCIHGSCVETNE